MRFIESILLRDGQYINLDFHQKRMNQVFEVCTPENNSHNLSQILPKLKLPGSYKVRVVYDMDTEDAEYDIEFAEYLPKRIETLEVVLSRPFDYNMKYEDRGKINELEKRSKADDIIISFNNMITDGSYFNLVFWDGSDWLTPNTPLLKGVRRTQLLQEKRIKEVSIRIEDLFAFEKVSLINAMLDLQELTVPVSSIHFPKNDD
ncbi:aminotransferase class IV [Ekhidna sp.]